MPRIYLDFSGMKQLEADCLQAASHVERLNDSFASSVRGLDWEIRMAEDIERTGLALEERLRCETDALRKYEQFLLRASEQYKELDAFDQKQDLPHTTGPDPFTGLWGAGGTMGSRSGRQKERKDPIQSMIEAMMEWLSKMMPHNLTPVLKDELSYAYALEQFLRGNLKGATGAQDLADLTDASTDLWKGYYDYLKDHGGGGFFFTTPGSHVADGVNITGDALSAASSFYGAVDTIRNSDMGIAGQAGELIDAGSNMGDLIESLADLHNPASDAVYSPTKFYTTIYESYADAIGQALKSYENYSADGTWDLGDSGATGIETGVAGLYKMAECLTFGLVSEDTTGVSAADISNSLETWAGGVGQEAGQYILNNPDLYQKYQDSGGLGKFMLTMYACIKS